jgi:hypothetical protein
MRKKLTLFKNIKRGSRKYKGNIPFICFNYGKVGHFVAKFPYKNKNNEEDSSLKRYRKGKTKKKRKFFRQSKNQYTNEDNNSSGDSDIEEILFMGLQTQTDVLENRDTDSTEDNPEVDAEINLEAKLISAFEEIDRLKEKNRKQKKELQKYKEEERDLEEAKKKIIILKVQVEEATKIEKVLKAQLKEKEDIYSSVESEIVYLRKELERSHTNIKFEKSSTNLHEMLNRHRSPIDRTGLGYSGKKDVANEEASTSSKQSSEERTKSYADIIKNSIKDEDNRKEDQYVPQKTNLPHKDRIKKTLPSRWNHTIRYQNYFFGYCYSCNGFGHKAIDCRTNVRDDYMRNNNKDTDGF